MRIIHILEHSFVTSIPQIHEELINVCRQDWHYRTAYYLSKYKPNKYSIECWRPDHHIHKQINLCIDNIPYKIFPSYPSLFWKYGLDLSPKLIKELKNEDENIIIHIHGISHIFSHSIIVFLNNKSLSVITTEVIPNIFYIRNITKIIL